MKLTETTLLSKNLRKIYPGGVLNYIMHSVYKNASSPAGGYPLVPLYITHVVMGGFAVVKPMTFAIKERIIKSPSIFYFRAFTFSSISLFEGFNANALLYHSNACAFLPQAA